MNSRSASGRPAIGPDEETQRFSSQALAALAADYTAHPGRWIRPDGAEITRDTYQPTYTARRPDGTTRGTYTGAEALLWIGAAE